MNRTWTVDLAQLKHLPTAGKVSVRAFDEDEAKGKLFDALHIEFSPCCEVGQEPCDECAERMSDRAQERREEGCEIGPRRLTPDEIRAQDADRGTLPERAS